MKGTPSKPDSLLSKSDSADDIAFSQQLSTTIIQAQADFVTGANRKKAFVLLLENILGLTASEYGFIGDVLHDAEGKPYLKTYAITDISWDKASKAFYDEHAPDGLEFRNLDSLFGAGLKSGQPVYANNPEVDPRRAGLPHGHPALNAFMGIPIYSANKFAAFIGLANKPGGYERALLIKLSPLLITLGQIFAAEKQQQENLHLKREMALLAEVASQTNNSVIITNMSGKVTWVNTSFTRLTGYKLGEIQGMTPGSFLQGSQSDKDTINKMRDAIIKHQPFNVDIVNYTKYGQPYWVRINCNAVLNKLGEVTGFISVQSDVTAEKRAEISAMETNSLLTTVLNTMVDGLITTDVAGIIQMANPAIEQMFGYAEKWLCGKNIKILMQDSYANAHDAHMHHYKVNNSHKHDIMGKARALTGKHSDGRIFPIEVAVKATSYKGNTLYVGTIKDITELKSQQDEIQQLVFFDTLTGLANRRLLEDRFKKIAISDKKTQACHALLILDLDKFKDINDTLGHQVGDNVLIEIAQRIQSCLHTSTDIVARLGGDEFCILISNISNNDEKSQSNAIQLAEKILVEIEKPLITSDIMLHTSASIGLTLLCKTHADFNDMMKQADIAMYEAKHLGRGRISFFDTQMESKLLKRLNMVAELKLAIQQNLLSVHYQPVVNDKTGIVKVEALVRWQHATQGWISPEIFIPIAEANQLIIDLGIFVLKTAIKDMQQWQMEAPKLDWQVAVNISQFQMAYEHFHQQVKSLLDQTNFNAHHLVFEITESAVAENIAVTIDRMHKLIDLGITFSMDDFGTGFSSLSYLKQLPITELKIDRSFVNNVPKERDDKAILSSVLTLAKALQLKVVAEGVENQQQLDFLTEIHCDFYQGYYFSRPLAATQISELINSGRHHQMLIPALA